MTLWPKMRTEVLHRNHLIRHVNGSCVGSISVSWQPGVAMRWIA